ncbi:type I restriction/modification system, specificity subunit [Arcobacter venerupis]|uniref:Type I restriction/modification system, specificity subunit n=1 Tax=Arcobacter venerupis TaxID=1054033 RepID=A0AAE7E530_9BACT|nr:restriction endonuclease subunit S [Arcobacter venerupis]QKF67361.1 type I restriction/modification system, specificity subunit [Arcobacter venerupis]RWS50624.1 hypothetical protein CKA56_03570 [Arcobacter venerupis]
MSKIPKLRFSEFSGDWEEKELKETSIINPKTKELPNKFIYIDLESVEKGLLVKSNEIIKDEAPSRAQRLLSINDILFQTVRPYQKNNYFFKLDGEYVASTGYAQIRANESSEFLYQKLHTDNFVNKVLLRCTGTSYPAINSTDLSKIRIYISGKQEQEKIASFLTSIDTKIEQLTKKETLLQEYKKGVMNKIFNQEIRFKADDGSEFPEWEEKRLGDIGKFSAGGDLNKLEYSKEKCEKYFYPIYANGAGEGLYGFATTFQYKTNCVTVSGRGNLGYANLRKENFNAIVRLIVIEPKSNICSSFLKEIINNINFAIESTGVPQLTVPQISLYKAFFPCIQEQTKIANFLSSIDKKIELTTKELNSTKEFKKALLQQMFV